MDNETDEVKVGSPRAPLPINSPMEMLGMAVSVALNRAEDRGDLTREASRKLATEADEIFEGLVGVALTAGATGATGSIVHIEWDGDKPKITLKEVVNPPKPTTLLN